MELNPHTKATIYWLETTNNNFRKSFSNIQITIRIVGFRGAQQGGVERRRIEFGKSAGRSNLVDADLSSGQGSRRNYRTCPSDVLIWTPSPTISFLCSNSTPATSKIIRKGKTRYDKKLDIYLMIARAAPFSQANSNSSDDRSVKANKRINNAEIYLNGEGKCKVYSLTGSFINS